MKACVVFCTIRNTESFRQYANNFKQFNHNPDIIIVDETGETRFNIQESFEGFPKEFWGAKERGDWFKQKSVDPKTVPLKTTDVIGFSLLIAYPRRYDMIVFVDDDTYPLPAIDFLQQHYDNLYNNEMRVWQGKNNWVNPHPTYFGRGYPYTLRNDATSLYPRKKQKAKGSVLNMGLWTRVPDLNAVDYLYLGNLKGQIYAEVNKDIENFILGSDYFPLSRMNVGFDPKIIPAFYQGTGDAFGVGRYGDVFSGLFVSKIAKHLGDHVSFGQPVCIHEKEPRNVFRDIKSEMESIRINEQLWPVLDAIKLAAKSYTDCYLEIAEGLLNHKDDFYLPEYIVYLSQRMKGWVQALT